MSEQHDPTKGLPIWEALERWAPEELWRRYQEIAEHDHPLVPFVVIPGMKLQTDPLEDEARDLRAQISRSLIERLTSGELIAAGLALPLKPTSRRRDIAPELWPRLEFSARFEEAFGERRLRFVDVFIREKEPAGAVAQEDRASKSRPRAARRRPGRPSIMKEIGEEMKRRAAFGELEPSLRREAEALAEWAQERFPEAHVPKPGSIERSHGKFYRELKAVNRGGK